MNTTVSLTKVPAKRPCNRLSPVPLSAVALSDSFWAPRQAVNREVTLPTQYEQCETTGRLDNFRRVSGRKECEFSGIFFNDSDIYKLLEAVAYCLPGDPKLTPMADSIIDEVGAAQDENGYLNTYFSLERKGARWTNLKDMHELYCAGHLIEAAVAHFESTGSTSILDVARRLADHICDTFGSVADGKREGACGHEEVEHALVALYRATNEPRYLEQARYFIGAHGASPSAMYWPSTSAPWWDFNRRYHQDHVKFEDLKDVVGHSVRMMYYACGAADVYAETGNTQWLAALEAQWSNMTQRRMYVTGGLGARWDGEAFGDDWELTERAYAETCAAIGSIMWNKRMLQIDGDARYADLMELQLFNAMLAGLSLSGDQYFYQNPLADGGTHRRQPWFGCACCPPNVARLLGSLPGYFYSVDQDSVWVHLFAQGAVRFELDGGPVQLRQETNYPWDGDIHIEVVEAPASMTALQIRIPAWAEGATVQVNDERVDTATAGSYARIDRSWAAGDIVRVHLPMQPRWVTADPRVFATAGKVALMRGPIVYCIEQADFPAGIDVRDVAVSKAAKLDARFETETLGGITVLRTSGKVIDRSAWDGALYRDAVDVRYTAADVDVVAIPYYAWANREAGPMTVWIHSVG